MKQKTSGMIAFLGILALAGCYSYASEAINNASYNEVQATPYFAKINVGDSDQILVRLVNAANNGALTSYTLGTVPAGILVHFNANYRPVWNSTTDSLTPTGDKTAQQYYVVGVTPGKYSFTLTPTAVNTAVSTTVTVIVSPIDIGAALSVTSGLHAGDTVTITLPAGAVFHRTAGTTVSVPSFTVGPAPAVVSFAADSSSMKILVAPGDSGVVTVTNIGQTNAVAAAPLSLASTNAIGLVPPITVAPTTVAPATPAYGASFALTLGNGLRFLSTSTVTIGTTPTVILGVSADSSTATVIPFNGGSGGLVSYGGIALSFLTSVPLSIPSDKSVAITPTNDPNTNALATAPTITFPDSGKVAVISGGGGTYSNAGQCAGSTGDGCQVFKFVLTGPTTFDLKLVWQGGADMGLYRFNSAGTTNSSQGSCDNGGQNNPVETCTVTALAAGTYYFGVVFFGTGSGYPPDANTVPPTWYQYSITRH